MMKVPGSYQSLQQAKADGCDVRVVYSPRDSVRLAAAQRKRPVVFFAVGFETTAPTIAASVLEAEALGLDNFFAFSVHKLVPPAMRLMDSGEVGSTVSSVKARRVVIGRSHVVHRREYGVPCVIMGFEPVDISGIKCYYARSPPAARS
jgi:hydrogenase expression/formation protein HypD